MNEWSSLGRDGHKNSEGQHKAVGVVRHSTSGSEDMRKVWSGSNVGRKGLEVTS